MNDLSKVTLAYFSKFRNYKNESNGKANNETYSNTDEGCPTVKAKEKNQLT